jgi:hypothetical protein
MTRNGYHYKRKGFDFEGSEVPRLPLQCVELQPAYMRIVNLSLIKGNGRFSTQSPAIILQNFTIPRHPSSGGNGEGKGTAIRAPECGRRPGINEAATVPPGKPDSWACSHTSVSSRQYRHNTHLLSKVSFHFLRIAIRNQPGRINHQPFRRLIHLIQHSNLPQRRHRLPRWEETDQPGKTAVSAPPSSLPYTLANAPTKSPRAAPGGGGPGNPHPPPPLAPTHRHTGPCSSATSFSGMENCLADGVPLL